MGYVEFTREMKRDYTILVPNMLPMHFEMIVQVLRNYGYRLDLLRSSGHKIADTGLKYCHNDACYPAILVIGQFMDALLSGRYDPHKVALIMFQTGGGCRASNYISLIRKALKEERGDMTKIIIAQRISSVMEADQIVVLNQGRVEALGTHEELLKTSEIYREVYESQMKGSDAE